MNKSQAGRKGGLTTLAKYGPGHFSTIGRKGAAAFHARYMLIPFNLSDFVIMDRKTLQVKGYLSGRKPAE